MRKVVYIKESSKPSWKELKKKLCRNVREEERNYVTESEEDIDNIKEAALILDTLEELEADRKQEIEFLRKKES